tara:strand:+ start:19 stop:126 length:108 start_codon:yes stop_codon:yes gene_type:complete
MSERTLSTKEKADVALVDAIAKSIRGPKKNSKDTK